MSDSHMFLFFFVPPDHDIDGHGSILFTIVMSHTTTLLSMKLKLKAYTIEHPNTTFSPRS